MLDATVLFASLLLALYSLLIFFLIRGWNGIQLPTDFQFSSHIPFSIVVAARNEVDNLPVLVSSIFENDIFQNGELVIVDDHSVDGTSAALNCPAFRHKNIKVIQLPDGIYGKKAAIAEGLRFASHDIILQTDADCIVSKNWIRIMLTPFGNPDISMVIGPVQFLSEDGFLAALFRYEFISLVATGAASAGAGRPVFCNAANLAFRKKAQKAGDFSAAVASGDDVFLLHALKRRNEKVVFCKNASALVETAAPKGIRSFFSQRVRWASKARHYTDTDSIVLSIFIAILNLSILALFFYGICHLVWLPVSLLFGGKFLADLLFMSRVLPFFSGSKLAWMAVPLSVFYPFYAVSVGIYSIFANYKWKGRMLKA